MFLTKKQLLESANQGFPEYLGTVPKKDQGVLKKKFTTWPKVEEVYVIYCRFDDVDVVNMEVNITLAIGSEELSHPNFSCICSLLESITECIVLKAPRHYTLFLKHFINYFFYQVLLEDNEINANEWNNWDKIRDRTLNKLKTLK